MDDFLLTKTWEGIESNHRQQALATTQEDIVKTIKNYELRIKRVSLADAGAPYGQAIREPRDVAGIAQALIGDSTQERFVVVCVDVKNRVLGYTEAAVGAVDSCPVDLRTVFRTAIALGASAIVVAHCHPSGDPEPSKEDLALTKRIKAAGDLIGVLLLDHVIVTDMKRVSLRERGDW